MPIQRNARAFIISIIAMGSMCAMLAGFIWTGDLTTLTTFILLAAFASTLKVRLPGIPGTFSANCFVTVLVIAELNTATLVAVSIICALVQSWWRARRRPLAIQVMFNAATMAISATVSGYTYSVLHRSMMLPVIASLGIASLVFFLVNTGVLSVLIGMIEDASPLSIWRVWQIRSLPFYVANVGLVALIITLAPEAALLGIAAAMAALCIFIGYRSQMRARVSAVDRA